MEQITIRKAVTEDLPVLLVFEQAVIEAERPFDSTLKNEGAIYYDIEALIASPDAEMLVAESDGKVIASGYAEIRSSETYLKHTRHSYLGFMYVLPEYRGKGVNKLIVNALFQWSRGEDVQEIRLEVYHHNAAAIRAYEKVGFESHLLEMRMNIETK